VWTHVLQTVFRYTRRIEVVSSFSYRSIYRTHQFQFPSVAGLYTEHISSSSFLLPVYIPNSSVLVLSVAGLYTEHISSSSFLLPVYIPNTSVLVPFCCRSTYRTHQFQFLSVAGLHTEHISSSPFCCRSIYRTHQFQFLSVASLHTKHISFPQFYCLAPQLCTNVHIFDTPE
jgi:hypothetical protein